VDACVPGLLLSAATLRGTTDNFARLESGPAAGPEDVKPMPLL
jgi:hypothetical protein